MENQILDHIALVVKSVDKIARKFGDLGCQIGEFQEFPNEGTREVYIGDENQFGKILLMQPISEGAYFSALKKRGEGLHHIAIRVKKIEKYLESLAGSGWNLHLKSLETYQTGKTVWLTRLDVKTLIEVFESEIPNTNEFLVSEIRLLNSPTKPRIFESLKISQIIPHNFDSVILNIGRKSLSVSEILE
ncbi:MAG: hypothetical protein DWQ06_03845 [Calditrichaeota bacterium]|nr:MAG: hypothetical protein DWQ06_03845 [Calditrichota bacterium]